MRGRRDWKSWITLFAAVTVAGIFIGVNAGPLEPPGPPGDPTMIPIDQVDPRIPIYYDMMPLTITQSASYYFADSIWTLTAGIIVQADDVTIDLMGFSLHAGTGPAIDGTGYRRTTVKNGTIQGWSGTGILLGSEAVLSNLIVAENQGSGIDVGMDSRIIDCTTSANFVHGIIVRAGSIVTGCAASNNHENGIWALGGMSSGALVIGCAVDNNLKNGIRVDNKTTVLNNHIRANDSGGLAGKAGIWVKGDYNRIEGNTIIENNIGIDLDGSHNTIARNIVVESDTANFDADPLAYYNLMLVYTIGDPGTPGPWDNFEQP